MPIYKTNRKKDGVQQYRVVVSFKNENGEYKKTSKNIYGIGNAKIAEMELIKKSKEMQSNNHMTLEALIQEYLQVKKQEVRATTIDKTRRIIELNILPKLGNIKIENLNHKVLQWKNDLAAKDIKTRTKQNIFNTFSAVLNYAVKMEYLTKNPLKRLGNFKEVYFEAPEEKIHFYTPEEFNKFIDIARQEAEEKGDWRYYIFFNIAFFTGMRKGEIHALKWSDLEKDIIHVRRSISQKIKSGDVETPPKTKSSIRDIQIPQRLLLILQEHQKRQEQIPRFSTNYRIVGGPSCLRDSNIGNKNKTYAKHAKLPQIRIHDFRHSHASLLANNGINIQEIARRLGHTDIKMTWNVYSHLYPKESERAVQILENI